MNVRFFAAHKAEKSSKIAAFLRDHHVRHELIEPESFEPGSSWYRRGEVPAVEVDGRLFVDPNDEALLRILELDQAV